MKARSAQDPDPGKKKPGGLRDYVPGEDDFDEDFRDPESTFLEDEDFEDFADDDDDVEDRLSLDSRHGHCGSGFSPARKHVHAGSFGESRTSNSRLQVMLRAGCMSEATRARESRFVLALMHAAFIPAGKQDPRFVFVRSRDLGRYRS